jgi:hypothetical protein
MSKQVDTKNISEESLHLAAQCWCDEETGSIQMDHRLAVAFAKRYDALQARLEKAVEALEKVQSKREMTRLANCCVEKSCHLNADTGTCSFQTGVNYGYADMAAIADEALKLIKGDGE